jgi:hypothetical protein
MSSPTPLLAPKTFHIAGIVVDVYGVDELPPSCESISCLWLMHGRLQAKEVMAATASTCIRHWNQTLASASAGSRGLICVSFDQRNHGTRQVDARANQSWAENENHAVDMYRWVRSPPRGHFQVDMAAGGRLSFVSTPILTMPPQYLPRNGT